MLSRRDLVTASLSAAGMAALALPRAASAQIIDLPLTPGCGTQAAYTASQIEGPYFTPSSPEKRDLRGDGPGIPLVLSGLVLTSRCMPVAGALVDLWHADETGAYDDSGFRFRGHQYTDDKGRYQFITRMPGIYPGRTRHFHVKVRNGTRRPLTTQLYFPDEPRNARDGIYDPSLLMTIRDADGGKLGRFDFVVVQ